MCYLFPNPSSLAFAVSSCQFKKFLILILWGIWAPGSVSGSLEYFLFFLTLRTNYFSYFKSGNKSVLRQFAVFKIDLNIKCMVSLLSSKPSQLPVAQSVMFECAEPAYSGLDPISHYSLKTNRDHRRLLSSSLVYHTLISLLSYWSLLLEFPTSRTTSNASPIPSTSSHPSHGSLLVQTLLRFPSPLTLDPMSSPLVGYFRFLRCLRGGLG